MTTFRPQKRRRTQPWNSAGSRPMRAHNFCFKVFSSARAATLRVLLLMAALQWPCTLAAAPVSVRFVEGILHGFLVLRTVNGVLIACGKKLQATETP